MVLDFLGMEGISANRAKGRLDPADLGDTIRAEALFTFSQKLLTAMTLGRQKKLEELFDQGTPSSKNNALVSRV